MIKMDEIRIKDLEVFCNHGVYEEETRLGQKFLVSCTLYLDTRAAGLSDNLDESINYGLVSNLIKETMEQKTFALIEAVAENLANTILHFDERINAVDIEIKKPWAPIGLPLDTASVKITRAWHTSYIAFGSNIGDSEKYIEDAINALSEDDFCRVEKVSSIIKTKPYGVLDQDDFLNGALKLKTLYTPIELLDKLHEIEQDAKRERIIRWGPRTLDLDIIFYDDEIIEDDDLCVPHIDMTNRTFVLEPMVEIAPYKRHPINKMTMTELLNALKDKE